MAKTVDVVAAVIAKTVAVMTVKMVTAAGGVHLKVRKFVQVVEARPPLCLQPKCENSVDHLSIPERNLLGLDELKDCHLPKTNV